MSSLSTRLALKRPDGTDPFLRLDFVNNWNKLDQYPGTFVCTSGTRPSWGDAQIGMNIYETDTKREYRWTGADWYWMNQPQRMPGEITSFAGAVVPSGWLLCDGTAVSRATYATLFSAIGTSYGVGNGSTTFNVPDYRGRSVVGAGAGTGLTNRVIGQALGEETHVLSVTEMPSHAHGGSSGSSGGHSHGDTGLDGSHTHVINASGTTLNPAGTSNRVPHGANASEGANQNLYAEPGGVHQHSTQPIGPHAHAISAEGGGAAHNNMQPSLVAAIIIKT